MADRSTLVPSGQVFSSALTEVKQETRRMALPSHPAARRRYIQQFRDSDIQNLPPHERLSKLSSAMAGPPRRTGSVDQGGGAIRSVMPKRYDPLNSPINKDIPYFHDDDESDDNREIQMLARQWCRYYYQTHHLVPTCIDIFARYPLVGLEHESSDPSITEFYDELFLGELEYEEFLTDLGTEYWMVGEAFPMGDWSNDLGVWVQDKLMNPDEMVVRENRFLDSKRYMFKVWGDDHPLKQLVKSGQPADEYQMLKETQPDLFDAVMNDTEIEVTPGLMYQLKHGGNAWSTRGYPLLMRGFRQLLLEERLNRAQLAISERLYTPLILLLLGRENLGEGGEPWVPTQSDINSTQTMFERIMDSEYRTLVHHFGLDIQVPLSGERMPNLDADYSRVETSLLGIFGISRSLIQGGQGGASYASTAISAEFLMQRLKTYQSTIVKFLRNHRYKQVAEAQGFYEYEKRGDKLMPKEEEQLIVAPDGTKKVVKRKKHVIPDLRFRTMDFRDERAQRDFMQTLKTNGVLISNRRLATGIDYDAEREHEAVVEEEVEKALTKAEVKKRVIEKAKEEKLLEYLDPAMLAESTDDVDKPAWMGQGGSGGGGGPNAPRAPQTHQNGSGDSKPSAPNKQRPDVSDNQRADMPKASRYIPTNDQQATANRFGGSMEIPEEEVEDYRATNRDDGPEDDSQ